MNRTNLNNRHRGGSDGLSKDREIAGDRVSDASSLGRAEPQRLKEWEKKGYYRRLQEQGRAEGRPLFVLHDGPPFANGHIHIGTALNKVYKDMVVRSKSMDGYLAPYVPGWDTHGLPIESTMLRELGEDTRRRGVLEFRRACRDYALRYVDIQREEFKRLGVWGDWDNPYLTLDPEYEARQIEVFGEMARKGHIYKGLKPVYWCSTCETALAEAEIEYDDHRSPSIYVKFPVRDGRGLFQDDASTSFLIWTTTPWTLPANLAIAIHPDFDYVEVEADGARYVVAEGLLPQVSAKLGWQEPAILSRRKGSELEGVVTSHPFIDRPSPIILGEHVTLEQGTGCVHTAPGHGLEDYEIGQKYGLDILAPVDGQGRFTDEAGKYAGLTLEEGNEAITRDMQADGTLLLWKKWRTPIPTAGAAKIRWLFGPRSSGLRRWKGFATRRWPPSTRWPGCRRGGSTASATWWPTAPTGVSLASGRGACRFLSFTVKRAMRPCSVRKASRRWPICFAGEAPTPGTGPRHKRSCPRAPRAPSAAAPGFVKRPTSWTCGSTRGQATPRCWRPTRSSRGLPICTWKGPTNTGVGFSLRF